MKLMFPWWIECERLSKIKMYGSLSLSLSLCLPLSLSLSPSPKLSSPTHSISDTWLLWPDIPFFYRISGFERIALMTIVVGTFHFLRIAPLLRCREINWFTQFAFELKLCSVKAITGKKEDRCDIMNMIQVFQWNLCSLLCNSNAFAISFTFTLSKYRTMCAANFQR